MQPTLEVWLKRRASPKNLRTALKRSGRVRRVSKRRAKENRVYAEKREAFLAANQVCMLGGPLYSAGVNPDCTLGTTEVHHIKRRLGGNFLDESTWAATCANCHRYVESHAKLARELGLIQ